MANKVFIDARMLFSSGIGTYLRNILKVASGTDNSKIVAGFLCNADDQQKWLLQYFPQAKIIRKNWNIYSKEEFIGLPIIASRSDVFWSPHFNFPVLSRSKRVVTVHDLIHLEFNEYRDSILKTLYVNLMLKVCLRNVDAIVTVSEFSKAEISRLLPVKKSIIVTTLNGVSPSWLTVKRDEFYSPSYFLSVANMKPHKNLERLINGFLKTCEYHDSNLFIVGQREGLHTSCEVALKRHASTAGDRVSFLGEVSDHKLQELVSKAAALIFPSLYEGFGLPPLEAMAANCPVLASAIPSVMEVCGSQFNTLNGEGNVLYFNPSVEGSIASTIQSFLGMNGIQRSQMAKNARKRAELFSWNRASEVTFKMLKTLSSK